MPVDYASVRRAVGAEFSGNIPEGTRPVLPARPDPTLLFAWLLALWLARSWVLRADAALRPFSGESKRFFLINYVVWSVRYS